MVRSSPGGFILSLLTLLFNLIFNLFQSKRKLFIRISLQQKEIEILKRKSCNKRVLIRHADRIILVVLNRLGKIQGSISIVKPETLLFRQRELIKKFWTFRRSKPAGRPPVSQEIKQLILGMKNDTIYWGYKKIQGELLKLGISLDKKTIRKIVENYCWRGKIKKSLSWKQFLSAQANSIYAMDFFTIDTLLNQRFYVFFIIRHKTREIVHFTITQNPARELVRQQLIAFSENLNLLVYLIHNNAQQFKLNYLQHDIKQVCTFRKIAKYEFGRRAFCQICQRGSTRFLLAQSEKQIRGILTEYIDYYNSLRPHQGIDQSIPQGYKPQDCGKV